MQSNVTGSEKMFVGEDSIVRTIWGRSDIILFIFAGASAEFALNKSVDWLYFTGRLPADPIGRLFSTVDYARQIVFASNENANRAIDKITSIHNDVEKSRGAKIPDWAYRDVLFMLIHYSIAAFELLERKMTTEEKGELFDVFYRMGTRMHIQGLPQNFQEWKRMRVEHMLSHLKRGELTDHLYQQYKKHLGAFRFRLLIEVQKLLVPAFVRESLSMKNLKWMRPFLPLYKFSKVLKIDPLVMRLLIPVQYFRQVQELNNR